MKIQIRFNTDKDKLDTNLPAWRVLENGQERLASSIDIRVPSWTSEDLLQNGVKKWHISCQGKSIWTDDGKCTVIKEE